MKRFAFVFAAMVFALTAASAAPESYELKSPDGKLSVTVKTGREITYAMSHGADIILKDSPVSMTLSDGTVCGGDAKVRKAARKSVGRMLDAVAYKKSKVHEAYNELTLEFRTFRLVFRAYDQGMAYRFAIDSKGSFEVVSEQASFAFAQDWDMWAAYVCQHTQTLESQFYNSFENTYSHSPVSAWNSERLAFLPLMADGPSGKKICIAESGLTDYPGMYLYNDDASTVLDGVFAPYPRELEQGGHNMLQMLVKSREPYIAECSGKVEFPWRIVSVSERDVDMACNDMVWLLGEPADPAADWSWVRPGKVAWEWWNDWNLQGVDFRAGINNRTYEYYVDFAAAHGIEYVILDEGWAVNLKADLFQVIPEINLEELVEYASARGVGLILWAGYWAFDRDMEEVCRHYSEMGIKGFKIDFMDRDDQVMVAFHRRAAETAAKYGLMLDFHGTYKPAGLSRTWPNVVNYEGVHGLEQMKWADASVDQVTYDVIVPYIRMMAGPMDYTQGAMRNATRGNFRAVNSEPMSQGTRCRQLAEYVVFDSPLNMLCDSPSNYMKELECTGFIASVPTVWDETRGIDGKVGEYIAIARRSGDVWYIGAMTDWNARQMVLDLSFLPEGDYEVELFRDGINADRAACDYRKELIPLDTSRRLHISMAPGGGFAARIVAKGSGKEL